MADLLIVFKFVAWWEASHLWCVSGFNWWKLRLEPRRDKAERTVVWTMHSHVITHNWLSSGTMMTMLWFWFVPFKLFEFTCVIAWGIIWQMYGITSNYIINVRNNFILVNLTYSVNNKPRGLCSLNWTVPVLQFHLSSYSSKQPHGFAVCWFPSWEALVDSFTNPSVLVAIALNLSSAPSSGAWSEWIEAD